MYQKIIEELKQNSEPQFAEWLKPYINITDSSDEIVLGVRVPKLRQLAKKYKEIDNLTLLKLLKSNIHEYRELALFIMLIKRNSEPNKMYNLYMENLDYINNWDLIDYTAPHIVAPIASIENLRELAESDYLWANRVAMVSTIYYIKQNDFDLALEFAEKFIKHPHHLMHKAAGWMLREIGKRDVNTLLDFLQKFEQIMPTIMRSYAKEKLRKS